VGFVEDGVVKSYVIGPGDTTIGVTELIAGDVHYGGVTASTGRFRE
jgi:hypothetical protein